MWVTVTIPKLQEHLLDKEYKLKRWPDFGAVDYIPGYIDLSAVLIRDFYPFDTLVDYTKLSKEEINHFLNAASMQGLLELRQENHSSPNTTISRNEVGFFSKLRKLILHANVSEKSVREG